MKHLLVLMVMLLATGCSTAFLNPNGTVKADFDPATGKIHYESDKSLNVELTKSADGTINLRINSDAASGINARNEAAKASSVNINELIKRLPLKP